MKILFAIIAIFASVYCYGQAPIDECKKPKVVSVNKSTFCLNDIIILSTPALPGAIYTWTGPNGFTSNQQIVNIPVGAYNIAGNYSLTITVNGCTSNPSLITIPPIRQTPVITLTIVENNPCTPQLNYTITVTVSNASGFSISRGRGARIISGTGTGPFIVAYNSPGPRTVTVVATNASGCTFTVSKIIDVPAIPAKPVINFNQTRFCLNDTIKLSTPQMPNTTYLWQGPNNFSSDKSSVSIPVRDYTLAGRYTLITTRGRCSSETVLIVPEILKNPTAAFSSDPRMPVKLAAPFRVRFINNSTDADFYLWDFGDGTTSSTENPTHEYITPGDFEVTLTAFRNQACSTSVRKGKFFIKAPNTIFIPNTFTPNSDQINDEFVVTVTNLNQYRIQIFNRFGLLVFQARDIFDNWKGTFQNELLPTGTYYYIIDAVDLTNEPLKKSGSITIIR